VQFSHREEDQNKLRKMMKLPKVQNHRQSIRYSESEENDMDEDSRSINQLKVSPNKKRQPGILALSSLIPSEGQSSMLMSVNDEEIQLEIKNQNVHQVSYDGQRRAPSKSVYESAVSDRVKGIGLSK
jgi:hypothetical protein